MALVDEIDRIESEYAEIHDRIENSERSDEEIAAIFGQENQRLSRELENALNEFFTIFIPIIYASRLGEMEKVLGQGFNINDFENEVKRLVDKNLNISKQRSFQTRQFKAFDTASLLQTRNGQKASLDDIVAKINNGILDGKNLNALSREVEQSFRERFKALDKNKEYMFQVQTTKGNFQRIRFDRYAEQVVKMTEINTSLDASIATMSSVGEDIMQVPVNSSTEDACVNWEGQFVSISGENSGRTIGGVPVYSMEELRSPDVHLWHINCRHFSLLPVIDPVFD